jgi:hypothetical protein
MMSITIARRLVVSAMVAAGTLCVPSLAQAQGWGVLGGANVNPDQVFAGARYEWPLVDPVWFVPSADAGFGSSQKLFSFNLDATYRRALSGSPWFVYGGGGPALNHYRFDTDTRTAFGVNLLGGLRHASGMFVEFRAGFKDSPKYRFAVGYMLDSMKRKTRRH